MFVTKGMSGSASGRRNSSARNGRYKRLFKLATRWSVVRFLSCGGTVLMILGLGGVLGLFPSLSHASLFKPPYWINWLHLSFGVFVWAVVILGKKRLQFSLALLAAIAATTLGLAGLAFGLYGAARHGTLQLPDLSDPLTHLAVGTLAIWALRNSRRKIALHGYLDR